MKSNLQDTAQFHFRQFTVSHGGGRSWKIGTDSILLGSWCTVDHVRRALDIGTGAGVFPLMLAQRSDRLLIDAIELLPEAVQVAKENFAQSPWSDRILIIAQNVMQIEIGEMKPYDLVICNPPYFPEGLAAHADHRRVARQGQEFSLWDVPAIAKRALSSDGKLAVVIPAKACYEFIELANAQQLFVHRRLNVRHSKKSAVSITLLELGGYPLRLFAEELILFRDGIPTPEYARLCRDFIRIEGEEEKCA